MNNISVHFWMSHELKFEKVIVIERSGQESRNTSGVPSDMIQQCYLIRSSTHSQQMQNDSHGGSIVSTDRVKSLKCPIWFSCCKVIGERQRWMM